MAGRDALVIRLCATLSAPVDETKRVVEQQEVEANEQAARAKEMTEDAQRDLNEALPALDAAVASLKNLSRNDIVEVKAMQNPPQGE
jgi:dynein heavy chain